MSWTMTLVPFWLLTLKNPPIPTLLHQKKFVHSCKSLFIFLHTLSNLPILSSNQKQKRKRLHPINKKQPKKQKKNSLKISNKIMHIHLRSLSVNIPFPMHSRSFSSPLSFCLSKKWRRLFLQNPRMTLLVQAMEERIFQVIQGHLQDHSLMGENMCLNHLIVRSCLLLWFLIFKNFFEWRIRLKGKSLVWLICVSLCIIS